MPHKSIISVAPAPMSSAWIEYCMAALCHLKST
jgi:hypothetical protein